MAFEFFAFSHTLGHERLGGAKLQVQPCPQCPVSDGRPEKGGLSWWTKTGSRRSSEIPAVVIVGGCDVMVSAQEW
jgi:hypothetical protein